MNRLNQILEKAYTSAFWLRILNIIMGYKIPFNSSHNFRIMKITKNYIRVKLPYIKNNTNHIRGMHACALATASEYACGLLIISNLNPEKYRLIMRSLKMDYIKQAKSDVYVEFKITEEEIDRIKNELSVSGMHLDKYIVEARNEKSELISIATLEWQLKDWRKIK